MKRAKAPKQKTYKWENRMKQSELREMIVEQLNNLFEVKYITVNMLKSNAGNDLRIWLSSDKTAIYLDNITDARVPVPYWKLLKDLQKEFGNLEVVKGDGKWIKADDMVVLYQLDDEPIDEKELEKFFKKRFK